MKVKLKLKLKLKFQTNRTNKSFYYRKLLICNKSTHKKIPKMWISTKSTPKKPNLCKLRTQYKIK